jgi:hypothetical protein
VAPARCGINLEITKDQTAATKSYTNASGLRLIELPRRGADVIHHGEQQDVRHGRSGSASIGLQWI